MTYTPSTEAIRCYWSLGSTMDLWSQRRDEAEAQYGPEFDAWLAAHDAEVRSDERGRIAAKIRAEIPDYPRDIGATRQIELTYEHAARIAEGS